MKNEAAKIVDFMAVVERLCYVERFTVMQNGVKEKDSDHIMKLCFWAFMVARYIKRPVNIQRMLELALVHDLAETDVGDVPYFEQRINPESIKAKERGESTAFEKYRAVLGAPLGDDIYALFQEFEAGETLEAKIVRALDIFDGNLQCNKEDFGRRYWKIGVGERVAAMRGHVYGNDIGEDIIKAIEAALVELSDSNKAKCLEEDGVV